VPKGRRRWISRVVRARGYSTPPGICCAIFDVTLAALLLALTSPLLIAIALLVWLRSGRPVIYKGTRLGLHKKPFTMYKFRTLVPDADKIIGSDLLGDKRHLLTPVGKFLRDTCLDELPQLINVLKGDMRFVGPRPIRPEVYEERCRQIPDYEKRFAIRPALIGMSQLFTPHSTPKRIRSLIDNEAIRKNESLLWNVYMVVVAGAVIVAAIFRGIVTRFYRSVIADMILGRFSEKRRWERIALGSASAYVMEEGSPKVFKRIGKLVDINPEAFMVISDRPAETPFAHVVKLEIQYGAAGARRKAKWALVECELVRQNQRDENTFEWVLEYTPTSPLNFYMIHQYFLRESVAGPC